MGNIYNEGLKVAKWIFDKNELVRLKDLNNLSTSPVTSPNISLGSTSILLPLILKSIVFAIGLKKILILK